MTFGTWIKEIRKSKKMTQRECAERIGVKPPVWSRWESDDKGRRGDELMPPPPQWETVRKIALGLDVPTSEALRAAGYTDENPIRSELINAYTLHSRILDVIPEGEVRTRFIEAVEAQAQAMWAVFMNQETQKQDSQQSGQTAKPPRSNAKRYILDVDESQLYSINGVPIQDKKILRTAAFVIESLVIKEHVPFSENVFDEVSLILNVEGK